MTDNTESLADALMKRAMRRPQSMLAAALRGQAPRAPQEAPVRRPLTIEEMQFLEALGSGENAQARRRVQEGIAEDRDFYITPFAPNRFSTGPVGPGGLGFGMAPGLVGDQAFELPAPETPDRAMITPDLLEFWRRRALQGV